MALKAHLTNARSLPMKNATLTNRISGILTVDTVISMAKTKRSKINTDQILHSIAVYPQKRGKCKYIKIYAITQYRKTVLN